MGTPFPRSKKRELTLRQLSNLGFHGCDCSLAVCLFDYGFAWRAFEGQWEMLIRRPGGNFELLTWDMSRTIEREFGWMPAEDWRRFCSAMGSSQEEILSREVPDTLQNLSRYYGYENCFGTSTGLLYYITDDL